MSRTLPGRLFLRGAAGVAVGMPLLESFGSKRAVAQETARATSPSSSARATACVQDKFWPSLRHGRRPDQSEPGARPGDFSGDKAVGVLSAYAEKLSVVFGLRYRHSGTGCGRADGCFKR